MNLQELLERGVITRSTHDWLEPLWRKEQEEEAKIRQEAKDMTGGGVSLFRDGPVEGNGEYDDEDEDDGGTGSFARINLDDDDGPGIVFYRDDFSAGHGNRVWHASVAMCLYLKHVWLVESSQNGSSTEGGNNDGTRGIGGEIRRPLRCLELGAGTALPSLYLAKLLSSTAVPSTTPPTFAVPTPPGDGESPFIHVTDGRQYRNLRQILFSIERQKMDGAVQFRVSPHNWGEGIGGSGGGSCGGENDPADTAPSTPENGGRKFFDEECVMRPSQDGGDGGKTPTMGSYDLILVSDCIYNPTHHEPLLQSIRALLKLPPRVSDGTDGGDGGRALVSFSLHGNTTDQSVWNFVDRKVGAVQCGDWRLQARAVPELCLTPRAASAAATTATTKPATSLSSDENDILPVRQDGGPRGWNMEAQMKHLDLWTANMEATRWIAYLYEITWVPLSVDVQ